MAEIDDVVSLREYIESLIDAQAQLTALRFDGLDRADRRQAEATAERFESVNAFRAQLTDQAATFQRTDVAQSEHAGIHHDIDTMRDQVAALRVELSAISGEHVGQSATLANQRALFGLAVITLGLLVSVAAVIATVVISAHG